MGQRLVLETKRGVTLAELARFVLEATEDYQIPENTRLTVRHEAYAQGSDEDGWEGGTVEYHYLFSVPIPDSLRERTVRVVKKKTKKERDLEAQVKEQIEQHKQDVKEGKKIAHVPPVKGTVKRKVKRKRKKEEPQSIDQAIQEIQETVPPKKKIKRKITTAYKTDKMEES